jgi:dCTP deaminase
MSTIVDHQIRELAENNGLIVPYNEEQLNPASYDVTLGDTICTELPERACRRWSTVGISTSTYWMAPGEFVLASTDEIIEVPVNLEAMFCLKSSRGREGYNHMLAAYIDPGFYGRVTLEIHNCNRFNRIPLFYGLRIGQIRFSRINSIPSKSYKETGRYYGDLGAQPSKG